MLSSCETARTRESKDDDQQMKELSNAAGASLLGIAGSRQVMHLDHQGEVKYKLAAVGSGGGPHPAASRWYGH
ncbi:MAG: hypothetical protein WKG07_00890 [Hymenobacter sp.]